MSHLPNSPLRPNKKRQNKPEYHHLIIQTHEANNHPIIVTPVGGEQEADSVVLTTMVPVSAT
jgi:hypothetical protein